MVCLDHNHASLTKDQLPPYFGPSDKQKALVQELSQARNLTRHNIHTLLTACFPNCPLTLAQVSNMMDSAKRSNGLHVEDTGGDMVSMVAHLLQLKEADPRWVVHVEVDAKTNCFCRVFWMSLTQISQSFCNGDVVVNDITLM
jgi:hypothetical protein